MTVKELLPIGSVVLLKGGVKKLMVIGIMVRTEEDGEEKSYDYIGVVYPEGYISNDTMILFQHDQINDVIFTGYHNPERDTFIHFLEEQTELPLEVDMKE